MPFACMNKMIKGKSTLEDIKGKEVVIFFGLGFSDVKKASLYNKYMFFINPGIMQGLLMKGFFKGKMPSWIKKPKKDKTDSIDIYCRDNHIDCDAITKKLVEENKELFLHEIGADSKTFEKAGITFKKPEQVSWW